MDAQAPADPAANRAAHLSIGEALDLLKAEFPDITISKIRFFEGQGLIEPERTPSGYRKFTLVDIERLRWVLRQQQEAYLPLKVLRERMAVAEAAGVVPATRPAVAVIGDVAHDAVQHGGGYDPSLRSLDDLDIDLDDLDVDGDDDIEDLGAIVDPVLEEALRGGASARPATSTRSDSPLDASAETMGEFRHPAARARSANLRPAPVAKPPASAVRPAPRATPASGPTTAAPAAPSVPTPAPSAAAPNDAASTAAEVLGSRNPLLGPAGGAAMAFHELAAASGLSLDDLRLLEEFGLITSRQMFDGRYYDSDALVVAKTVVAFRAFGVEPRHLRMYKSAADREAAFFAQVVSPVLHRRGDDARTKAAGTIAELRRLGEQLRDVALSQALRDVLEGR